MKTIFEHIEHVKTQPHHVKTRVAFGAAYAVAGLVAVVWLGASLATGAFALGNHNFAEADGGAGADAASAPAPQVAGAAAAFGNAAANAPAHIEIVDASTTPAAQKAPTVIPF